MKCRTKSIKCAWNHSRNNSDPDSCKIYSQHSSPIHYSDERPWVTYKKQLFFTFKVFRSILGFGLVKMLLCWSVSLCWLINSVYWTHFDFAIPVAVSDKKFLNFQFSAYKKKTKFCCAKEAHTFRRAYGYLYAGEVEVAADFVGMRVRPRTAGSADHLAWTHFHGSHRLPTARTLGPRNASVVRKAPAFPACRSIHEIPPVLLWDVFRNVLRTPDPRMALLWKNAG